ncbi:MAG: phage baseplate assembly protein V [Gallionella sp.]
MKQLNGVFPAVVVDNVDPNNSGRVKVRIPHLSASIPHGYETFARMATLMAGKNRGTWFIPDVNDEVLVAFEAGDMRRPYVIGCLWSGTNSPPETMDMYNNKKILRSRNGVKITLDDQSGQECFIVETPGGQSITLKDGPGSLAIEDSNGNLIKFESTGITITASAKVTVNASEVSISASMLKVDAGMSKFSGVVQADTVITNSVISASYTPGAGNIW